MTDESPSEGEWPYRLPPTVPPEPVVPPAEPTEDGVPQEPASGAPILGSVPPVPSSASSAPDHSPPPEETSDDGVPPVPPAPRAAYVLPPAPRFRTRRERQRAPAQLPPAEPSSNQLHITAQGDPVTSYPGYGGEPAQVPAARGVSSVSLAAIAVGFVAFIIGWMPFVGPLAAAAGLYLGIRAVTRPRGKVLGIIGIILSALALIVGMVATIGFLASRYEG